MKIILIMALLIFLANITILFAIGWGVFYPRHDIIILFHMLVMVISLAVAFAAGDEISK